MKKYNPLLTLISSVLIVMSVSAYGQNPLSPKELEEYITDNAQAIIDAGEDRAALKRQIQQLQEEKKQLKETVDKLAARLEDYAKEQQAKYSEDIAELQKQITANQGTANTAVTNAKKAQTTADTVVSKAYSAQLTANSAQSTANSAVSKLSEDISFPRRGTPVEPDGADKMFHSNNYCPVGRIIAAHKDDNQAAICVCLSAERGKGWYCFS